MLFMKLIIPLLVFQKRKMPSLVLSADNVRLLHQQNELNETYL